MTKLLRQAQRNHFVAISDLSNSQSAKKFWRTIKALRGTSGNQNIGQITNPEDDSIAVNPTNKAELLNNQTIKNSTLGNYDDWPDQIVIVIEYCTQ